MRNALLSLLAAVALPLSAAAADQTLQGKISDSHCGDSHKSQLDHGKSRMGDRGCTLACVKNGAKYVLVADAKVYNIENQTFAGLRKHAGQTVKLSGEVKENTITVSKVELVKAEPKTTGE
ncbi:MAG: hypothetical protein HY820_00675 [Acidobacteria bacterium]|nr:hypothetical protein [Acidobacteriota bacterium]